MLTQVVADRVYDYSHAVGGGPLEDACPISLAVGSDDVVYVCCKGREDNSEVPWNMTGADAKVSRIRMGPDRGDEELLGELGRYGIGDGQFIWPTQGSPSTATVRCSCRTSGWTAYRSSTRMAVS